MKKSEIRKKILEIRKKGYQKKSEISFDYLLNYLKKNEVNGKLIGGYYPYNYEVNVINILEKFERKNYLISLPKIKKKLQDGFF